MNVIACRIRAIPLRATLPFVLVFLAGCETDDLGPGDAVVQQYGQTLRQIQADVGAVKESQEALIAQYQALEGADGDAKQFVSDRVHVAQEANARNKPSGYTLVVDENLKLTRTRDLLPPPTAEARLAVERELKLALSEREEDLATLRAQYVALQADAAELAQERDQLREEVEVKENALATTSGKLEESVSDLEIQREQAELARNAARDHEQRANRERQAKVMARVAAAFMLAGGLAAAAGIVATFMRVPGVLTAGLSGGGVLFALGWTMSFVEDVRQKWAPWFDVAVILLTVAVIVLIGWRLWGRLKVARHKADYDDRISNETIGAIEELRVDDERYGLNRFELLEPYLKQWHTDVDGELDTGIKKEIRRRCIGMNLVNAGAAKGHRASMTADQARTQVATLTLGAAPPSGSRTLAGTTPPDGDGSGN